jgi:hypothetical protein
MRQLESARRGKAVRLLCQKVNSARQNFKSRTIICNSKEGQIKRVFSDVGENTLMLY